MQVINNNGFRGGSSRRVITPMLRNDRFSRLVVSFVSLSERFDDSQPPPHYLNVSQQRQGIVSPLIFWVQCEHGL